ncbi:hypothetical protein SHELI_v1c08800 [Spiroplasma helicoides]|uniref:Lipolytic enzyme, GDSL family n=1 Tax=Spiroplasma helicoides TaxID=216938 RepID=A0A1B3SLM0_9MOLU|nr:SGNH/GDSL hydrolase family protein [Spiroplasma helicoides]AOG60829.1 hypothetical protein SHELI_v1c08800 [Spiroplasma helicoides]
MNKLLNFLATVLVSSNVSLTVISCNKEDTTHTNERAKFEHFYGLGDSLSDAGGFQNIAQTIIDKQNPGNTTYKEEFGGSFKSPYFENKYPSFTNGIPAVEWVNKYLGFDDPMKPGGELLNQEGDKGRNYAVGGAKASDDISFTFSKAGVKDVPMKVDIISQSKALIRDHTLSDKDLVFLEIGGNDFLEGISQALALFSQGMDKAMKAFKNVADKAATNLNTALTNILETGANVVYMNSPDMRYIPNFLGAQLGEDGEVTDLSKQAAGLKDIVHTGLDDYLYNATLNVYKKLDEKYANHIAFYDLYSTFSTLKTDYAALYKTKFNKEVNLNNNYGWDTANGEDPNVAVQSNFPVKGHENNSIDDFFFIDEVHPTRYVHQYAGKMIYNLIQDTWFDGKDKKDLTIDDIK